ncbi:hypothetical protein P9272_31405 [Mesorhizobium sp. WSM4976]|uniref:hypothetical protein n=1 Tax=Mesorhizobium sp. WSM4976 TaxID=3038549 RepID=UPI0024171AB6|nr:hypothetical protein [Mesorhizobium sp. WSM4976]MDG4898051.1 hypothetical protein [Mesorhizobium sp. WSM4976]
MTKSVVKPVKATVVDQRAADLAKIDAEIAGLGQQVAEKKAALDADTRLHALDQDVDMQNRLGSEISTLAGLIDQLRDKRFKIEIGEAETIVAPKSAAPIEHRAWDIDEKILLGGEPAYPSVERGNSANKDAFSRAYLAIKAYWEALIKDLFRKDGYHPDDRVTFDFVTSMQGEVMANFRWYSARCKALEDRVKQLEERPSVEYRGSWKADEKYRRGDLISHAGSVWHCELAGSGIVPGEGAIGWRLAVKRGRDGKDATR